MEKDLSKELSESLKRHRELLGYDPTKGKSSLEESRYRHTYPAVDDMTDYADEEETTETEEETTDTEGGEEGGDNPDFDFGGEEEGGDEETADTEGGEEEDTDEFGTADEFSAADELETEDADEEVEEIDVTDIVKRADDAKGYSEKAVKAAEEGKNMITDLMSKFDALQSTLSKIDTVANELNVIKRDIQSQKPKEKLELRSLDSYPFNVKLTDYWNDEKLKDNYEVTSGTPDAESQDGEVKVWKVKPEDVKDYNTTDIKKSFVPESNSKKKVLKEFYNTDDSKSYYKELESKSLEDTLRKIKSNNRWNKWAVSSNYDEEAIGNFFRLHLSGAVDYNTYFDENGKLKIPMQNFLDKFTPPHLKMKKTRN